MSISELLDLDAGGLLSYSETWGPSVRTCINLLRGYTTVKDLCISAVLGAYNFASNPLNLIAEFNSSEVSHVLFAVSPEELSGDSRQVARVLLPTKHLHDIVALAVVEFDTAQQPLSFSRVSLHPYTLSLSDLTFASRTCVRCHSAGDRRPHSPASMLLY